MKKSYKISVIVLAIVLPIAVMIEMLAYQPNTSVARFFAEHGFADIQLQFSEYATAQNKPAESFHWMKKAAENGSSLAEYNLGYFYFSGYGTLKDMHKAFHWYQVAAQHGDMKALINVGNFYSFGNVVKKDRSKACEYYAKAAAAGLALGQYNSAVCLLMKSTSAEQKKKAIELLQKSAASGDVNAQLVLGVKYFSGDGVEPNIKLGVRLLNQAATQGSVQAKHVLGSAKIYAEGVEYDADGGVEMIIEAAQKNPKYYMTLVKYYDSLGNRKQSDHYLRLAADNGYAKAQYWLANMTQDPAEKIMWLTKAAAQNHIFAINDLGFRYATGKGVPVDVKRGMALYRKAALLGDSVAMYNIAWHYLTGDGVPKDMAKAYTWYQRSYSLKTSCAANDLGYMHAKHLAANATAKQARHFYHDAIIYAAKAGELGLPKQVNDNYLSIEALANVYADYMLEKHHMLKNKHKLDNADPSLVLLAMKLDGRLHKQCWS